MTSGTSGGGLLGGVISLSISDRCLGGGDLSVFPSGFFSAAFSSSSVGVFDHCKRLDDVGQRLGIPLSGLRPRALQERVGGTRHLDLHLFEQIWQRRVFSG